ncbi:MAG: magnesium/cobalt transporter CorA [Saprospiraceae bacterium]|nr:magnesium/cobalt transporter CorA [Saprospiraceae bacterium]
MASKVNLKKRISKKGLPPGTKIYTGMHAQNDMYVEYRMYNQEQSECTIISPEDMVGERETSINHWFNIIGVHNSEIVKYISDLYDIHLLHQEDIMNVFQRPKLEEEKDYSFIVMKMIVWNQDKNELDEEQLSFFLFNDTLLTFQERAGDIFDPIRERLKDKNTKVRERKVDYLLYLLLDIIVDHYFEVLDKMGEKIEEIEDNLLLSCNVIHLSEIQKNKKDLILMRKIVYPLRELISKLLRNENQQFEERNLRYLRDIYDHSIQLLDTIDSYREINVSLKDIYLNTVSNDLNKVMKMLTIISTVFIPLTFIVGVYGMNFDAMPELRWKYGYLIVWIIMVMIVILLVIYFRRKKWL